MTSYSLLKAGQKTKLKGGVLQLACCDCGLIHTMKLLVTSKGVFFKMWRNNRATAQYRKRSKHQVVT